MLTAKETETRNLEKEQESLRMELKSLQSRFEREKKNSERS